MRETANSRRCHFADFTRANYAALVRMALGAYPARTYKDFSGEARFVLWRHDVDFSLHSALKLAQIEAGQGLVATYFLLPHSEFYNLLERECAGIARSILALGHRLGLHLDHRFWQVKDEPALVRVLAVEKKLLEDCFEQEVEAFSFHVPDDASARFGGDSYAGLVNAYSAYFKSSVGYCSDSNGYWRHRRLEDVLRERRDAKLQVLTHPEYWQDTVMSPRERVERCIRGRADKTREWYRDILQKTGRENVDW